jgi:hypothetical protein
MWGLIPSAEAVASPGFGTCWAAAHRDDAHGTQCFRPAVSDLGLCDTHLAELRADP